MHILGKFQLFSYISKIKLVRKRLKKKKQKTILITLCMRICYVISVIRIEYIINT